jgi:hypothetical protein
LRLIEEEWLGSGRHALKTQKDGNERPIDGNTLVVYVGVEEMR